MPATTQYQLKQWGHGISLVSRGVRFTTTGPGNPQYFSRFHVSRRYIGVLGVASAMAIFVAFGGGLAESFRRSITIHSIPTCLLCGCLRKACLTRSINHDSVHEHIMPAAL